MEHPAERGFTLARYRVPLRPQSQPTDTGAAMAGVDASGAALFMYTPAHTVQSSAPVTASSRPRRAPRGE